jgi:hypothetical protein
MAAPMTDSPGVGTFAASEATLMMHPEDCARIKGQHGSRHQERRQSYVGEDSGEGFNWTVVQQCGQVRASRRVDQHVDAVQMALGLRRH